MLFVELLKDDDRSLEQLRILSKYHVTHAHMLASGSICAQRICDVEHLSVWYQYTCFGARGISSQSLMYSSGMASLLLAYSLYVTDLGSVLTMIYLLAKHCIAPYLSGLQKVQVITS